MNLEAHELYVLPTDLRVVPASQFGDEERARIGAQDGDFVLTRSRARSPSKVVDGATASLLNEFKAGANFIDAIISFSRKEGHDPEEVLASAFNSLSKILGAGFLISKSAVELNVEILSVGTEVGDFLIVKPIQVLDDSEVHFARGPDGVEAAIKVAGLPGAGGVVDMIAREERILKHLNGSGCPKFLRSGTFNGHAYLATSWIAAVPVSKAAETIREQYKKDGHLVQLKLLELAIKVVRAFASLHSCGVIHADVHPRNVLIDSSGSVSLIDFGHSQWEGFDSSVGGPKRAGVPFYFEPEIVANRSIAGGDLPPPSLLGEQYAVAALIYFILCGSFYLEFSAERDELRRQIVSEQPTPMSAYGWEEPEIDRCLRIGLSKLPSDRYVDLWHMANDLERVRDEWRAAKRPDYLFDYNSRSEASACVEEFIERNARTDIAAEFNRLTAPRCSLYYGAPGVAYALYRLALDREDSELLFAADSWSMWAMAHIQQTDAFINKDLDLDYQLIGPVSAYHGASGVYAVQSLISIALGDVVSFDIASNGLINACESSTDNIDPTLGSTSILTAVALIIENFIPNRFSNLDALTNLGNNILDKTWSRLDRLPPISYQTEVEYCGIAHGWAGIIFASLRWCEATNCHPPAGLKARLGQLAMLADPIGWGVRWQARVQKGSESKSSGHWFGTGYLTGWCHGNAGYVFLWAKAHEFFGDERYRVLAERAGFGTLEQGDTLSNLCCGTAGRVYALLRLYNHTGDGIWLEHAHRLGKPALQSIHSASFPKSLYKGNVGLALLAADLLEPDRACMPFFERQPCTRR